MILTQSESSDRKRNILGLLNLIWLGKHCTCILKKSTTEAQQTYQEEYNKEIKARAEKINQIINALFVPISILMLFWCIYNLWKRKRKKQIALEKKREALTNLDNGKLFCMEKHPLSKKTISIKRLYKSGKIKKFMPIYCEKCLTKYPRIKQIHKCFEKCNFNICRDCFCKAFSKMKAQIENKNYEQKLESRRNHFRKNGRKKMRIGHKKKKLNISKRMRKRLVKRIKYKFKNLFRKDKAIEQPENNMGGPSIYKDRSTIRINKVEPSKSDDQSWTTSEGHASQEEINETKRAESRELSRTFSIEDEGTKRLSHKKRFLQKENSTKNQFLKISEVKRRKRHTVAILRNQGSRSLTNLRQSDMSSVDSSHAQDELIHKKRIKRSVFKNKVQPFKKYKHSNRFSVVKKKIRL